MTNLITEKQMNYIMKLDPNKTAEMLKDLSIKEASIMIYKLKKQPKPKEYEHGFKVGDVLYADWGYEQTNLDFFQVVKVSESSVWVKEVVMKKTEEDMMSHGMARDIAYDPKTAKPIVKSFWFSEEEQAKGKLLRISNYTYNGKKTYYVKVHGRYTLYHYNGEKLYESWYA